MGAEKERKKFEKDYNEDILDILALTGEIGPGGGKKPSEELWTWSVTLLGYIDTNNNEIHNKKINVKWQDEHKDDRFNIQVETMYRLRVRKSDHSLMLVEVVEENIQNEVLQEMIDEFKKPVIINADIIKELVLNKSLDFFEGKIILKDKEIKVDLDAEEFNCKETLDTFHAMYDNMDEIVNRCKDYASKYLLDNANDWQEDGESEITKEEFINRMSLYSINVEVEGNYTLSFDDDDMFCGHTIMVSGNIDGRIESADI